MERDELDKWAEHVDERRKIEAFIDWCWEERKLSLDTDTAGPIPRLDDLLNDYFHIDYERLEAQRRALLDEHRRATGQEE